MRAYLARGVVQALVVLVLVSLGGFTVLHLAPGGPVAIYAMSPTMSAEDMERLTRQLGLDQPLHVQYAKWAGGLVTANWGRSYRDGRVVLEVIADRIPATLVLMLSAFTVAVRLGLTTGIVSAVRQYSILDHAMTLGAMVALSIPTFWLGLMGIYVFADLLRVLPLVTLAGLQLPIVFSCALVTETVFTRTGVVLPL